GVCQELASIEKALRSFNSQTYHRIEVSTQTHSIWTRAFALLCFAQLFGYAQHAILTPTLPLYITHLGGSPLVVGVVLAAFAATSVVVRPVFGELADRWSE